MRKLVYDTKMRDLIASSLGEEASAFASSLPDGTDTIYHLTSLHFPDHKVIVQTSGENEVTIAIASKSSGQQFVIQDAIIYKVLDRGWVPTRWFSDWTGASDNFVIEKAEDGTPTIVRRSYTTTSFLAKVKKILSNSEIERVCLSIDEVRQLTDAVLLIDPNADKSVPILKKLMERLCQ